MAGDHFGLLGIMIVGVSCLKKINTLGQDRALVC